MNKRILVAAMCSMTVSVHAVTVMAWDGDVSVAMVVNGEPASKASLDLLIEARKERGEVIDAQARENLSRELLTRMVLSQQARKQQLDQDEKVLAQKELNDRTVLSQAYLREYAAQVTVSDEEQISEYQEYLQDYDANEFHVRQILVKNEVTAKELIAQLNEGADFVELAKEHSIDPGASETGGDIGWFRPDVFIDKRLSGAVEKLSAGEYSEEPVQTRFGWHVVKVEEGPRKVKFPEFEELSEDWKKNIHDRVVMKKVDDHIKALIDAAKVEIVGKDGDHLALKNNSKQGGSE